ncbi:hypothetical protein J2853_001761 [Streptosporangium lutulentum]|uniref:Uncharacterized protein n=1 Tax=Streptosporangium lutulentum TaxID=1461250 RepID=A0ABT9Q721_9ACTN|nr:hypothetical protein [Streptosporangium lutulentum]
MGRLNALRAGPANAPTVDAAASAVMNTAPTRPRSATGVDRCSQVCRATITVTAGIPRRTAASSATGKDRALNIRKNAPATRIWPAATVVRTGRRSTILPLIGAPIRKPALSADSSQPTCVLPPREETPNGTSSAVSAAFARR